MEFLCVLCSFVEVVLIFRFCSTFSTQKIIRPPLFKTAMRNDVQFMPFMRTLLVESILFYLLCMHVCSATGNIYVTPSASHADDFSLVLIDLNINPMARCLDGSPGSYYFSRGTGSGISSWSIHTMGGGWCTDIADCVERRLKINLNF